MLKFEQLMDGSFFNESYKDLPESQVASLFDEHATFKEIVRNVIGLDDINLNIFGNYLYYSFFAETSDEGELDFSIVDVLAMLTELDDYNIYQVVNSELKRIISDPEYFMEIPFDSEIGLTDADYFDPDLDSGNAIDVSDGSEGISEAKIHIMTAKTANKKRRKFFTLSKAQLLRNKPKNKMKNRMNRAKTRAYKRANAAKIKRYQVSRQRLIDKGLHNVKLRRKA